MSQHRKLKRRRERTPEFMPLVDITAELPDDFFDKWHHRVGSARLVRVWNSNLYEVFEYEVPEEDIPGGKITWLSIKRLDKNVIRDWRHLQWIKNQICGEECEACELFPAESRLVDTSNQFHLWVLKPGYRFPFGYGDRAVVASTQKQDVYIPHHSRQRPFPKGMAPSDAMSVAEADKKAAEFKKKNNTTS